MSKPEQKQVIVELQNGDKCEGVLANIDKVNLNILLVNAKKTTQVTQLSQKVLKS